MAGRIEVLQRMRVCRVFAASDMTADQTNTKLRPWRADREALLAAVGTRLDVAYFGEMFALLLHGNSYCEEPIVDDAFSTSIAAVHRAPGLSSPV